MRERRAEQRHDSVAHDLIDCAFVAMHSFHHVLENRIKELARFFGISIRQQFHGAFHVSEQNRHVLAFTFQSALRGKNFFS
jgi:hypothetical protein